MKNTKIIVKTKSNSYPIYFGSGNLNKARFLIKKNLPEVKKICIISDKNLPSQTLKKLTDSIKNYKPKIYKISSSEKTIILATAHPSKFSDVVMEATKIKPELPESLRDVLIKKDDTIELPNELQLDSIMGYDVFKYKNLYMTTEDVIYDKNI